MGTPTLQTCLSHWSSSELFSLSGRLPSLIRWSPNLQRAPRWRASRTAATSQSSSKLTTAAPHTTAILGAATLEEHAGCHGRLVEEHVTFPGTRRVMTTTIAFVLWDCVRSRARAFPRSSSKLTRHWHVLLTRHCARAVAEQQLSRAVAEDIVGSLKWALESIITNQ